MINLKSLIKNPKKIFKKIKKRIKIKYLKKIINKIKKKNILIKNIQFIRNENKKKTLLFFKTKQLESKIHFLKYNNIKNKYITKKIETLEKEINKMHSKIPNIPDKKTPIGINKNNNKVIKKIGKKKIFKYKIKNHIELGNITNTIEYEIAAKVTTNNFIFYKGMANDLNRSLINFLMDFHKKYKDIEISPPYIVNSKSMFGTGQLPKFKKDLFKIKLNKNTELFLIPTAETPITNYFSEINIKKIPIRICSYSPCFRKESGSHGKKDKGIIRLHQFEKIELVRISSQKKAKKELFLMIKRTSKILSLLKIPHRIVLLCTADLGFSSRITYDIEVWFPQEKKYKEISSCSDFGKFQSRRINIKYGKKKKLANTLNGSSLPLGRTIAAIYENYQTKNGNIRIPKILRKYIKNKKRIKKTITY